MKIIFPLMLALLAAPLSSAAPRTPELPITVESLGLSFRTPDGWRLLSDSTAEQLVLAPGKTKRKPLLRVRAFRGGKDARSLLPEMTRTLAEEEALMVFASSELWTLDGHEFETVIATYKKGSQEWYARFTVLDQPNELQHGFWLFGRKQELERTWSQVQASIRSALAKGATGSSAKSAASDKKPDAPAVGHSIWKDVKSGLRVASWPAEFRPDEASLARLSTTGVVMKPESPDAPAATELRLSRRSVGDMVTAQSTADTLEERLGEAAGVSDIKRLKLRVAGEPAVAMRWTQATGGNDYAYEVWLWKRGSALFRLDSTAEAAWAGARKRRDLVKNFAGGLSFP